MKIIFLGTNGWYDTETGNTTCILIETKKEFIILDAGNGLHKIDRYIKTKKPIYLFLSHFHLDHIIGLHTLNKFIFFQEINVYGPKRIKDFFRIIINRPYTIPITQLKIKIGLHELNKKMHLPINVEFRKLRHSSLCYGFRFVLENKIISYCPDTGICNNLLYLAKNADLLITECSFKSGQQNERWPHLNPDDAAQVARVSGVKKLALVHFDACIYQTFKERKLAEKRAIKIFKNTFAARDNQKINL